jgi:hypothetical protein
VPAFIRTSSPSPAHELRPLRGVEDDPMSSRRNRTSPMENEKPTTQESTESAASGHENKTAAGPAKSPFNFMFLFWGLPLIFFIVVAIIKQCH